MDVQWPLLIFGLLAGLGMGCLGFVSVSILTGKAQSLRIPGLIVALITLGIGGIASALHMGNPGRILHILENFQSGITQELVATVIAGIVILALLVAITKKVSGTAIKALAVLGLLVAVALPFITGEAYVQGARPAWNTLFLPLMYIGASAAMGMFTMYLVAVVKKTDRNELTAIGKATCIAIVLFGITVALYLAAIALAPYPDPTRSIDRVLFGDLAVVFWIFVVILGLCVPLAFSGAQWFSNSKTTSNGTAALSTPAVIGLGLVCIICGSVAIRMIMYLLGSSVQSFIY